MIISSITNNKIKELSKLNTKKGRKENKMFIVEGEHLVNEALKNNLLVSVYAKSEYGYKNETIVTDAVMKKLTNLDSTPNIIGICKIKDDYTIKGNNILILDNIQDPGNLGTIIRSAVAFNIDTIVLSKDTVDVYNEKVLRATQGMIFNINIIIKNLNEIIPKLKDAGYKIYSTNVVNGTNIKDVSFSSKCAIIMGNEGNGVKREIQDLSDEYIYIKMNDKCESLNVGVATGIILHELSSR